MTTKPALTYFIGDRPPIEKGKTVIAMECPHCHEYQEHEFVKERIPPDILPAGGSFSYALSCSCADCEKSWDVWIRIDLSIKFAKDHAHARIAGRRYYESDH